MIIRVISLLFILSKLVCSQDIISKDEEKVEWIIENAYTFNTAEPIDDHEDIIFLKDIIGNSKIVALGESTHGTSEFFKMKHRILKYLVEEMDFTVIAIEANMPEAHYLNQYVLNGVGDPEIGLSDLHYWTVNTIEFLDMVRWMHDYNIINANKVEFWGIDLQYIELAMTNVLEFVEYADSEDQETIIKLYDEVILAQKVINTDKTDKAKHYKIWQKSASKVVDHLEKKRNIYRQTNTIVAVDWIIQNARIVVQCASSKIANEDSRDKSMADNVNWILSHNANNTKIVIWSHNGHITKAGGYFGDSLGKILAHQYGEDIISIGFAFYEGQYTARGGEGFKLGVFDARLPKPGSLEWIMHKTGFEMFIIDLRMEPGQLKPYWLTKQFDFRAIGSVVQYPTEFFPKIITEEFDALIYFDQTSPTALLN